MGGGGTPYPFVKRSLKFSVSVACVIILSWPAYGWELQQSVLPEEEVSLERAGDSPFGEVRLEYAGSIGSEDEDDYFFSIIRGIAVDKDDNVVVFDGMLKNIRVFTKEGELIRKYDLVDGSGPGEFQRASTFSLSRDKEKIYLYDMVTRRITILDYATFHFVDSFPLPETSHAGIEAGPDNTIIAVYFQLDLADRALVHVFSEDGTELAAFERRHPAYYGYLEQDLQAFHRVTSAQSDSLFFLSFALPYDIRVFSRDHELIRRFHLSPDFFGDTVTDGEWLYPSGYCSNLVVAGDEILLQFVEDHSRDETWMHVFDFSGRSRGVTRLVGNEWGDRFGIFGGTLDSTGHVYGVSYDDGFPKIIRLKVVAAD